MRAEQAGKEADDVTIAYERGTHAACCHLHKVWLWLSVDRPMTEARSRPLACSKMRRRVSTTREPYAEGQALYR